MRPTIYKIHSAWTRLRQRAEILPHKWRGREVVHVMHMGKTGGSAVKALLSRYPVTERYAIIPQPHSFCLRDVPIGEKAVFFLRDPVSRFVSGFYSRKRQGRPRHFAPWSDEEALAFSRFETPNELGLALSSGNTERRDQARQAMRAIKHVCSTCSDWFEDEAYFTSRWEDILFVGFQETLDLDMDRLKKILGLPDEARLPSDEVIAHRNPAGLDRRLDEQAVQNLQEWYRDDYAFIRLCHALLDTRVSERVKSG